jgi:hypothetical protein
MSHTLRKVNLGNTAFCDCVIVNYPTGGESFTLAELGITGGVSRVELFELSFPGAFPYFPVVVGNKIVLLDNSTTQEIAPQTGINYPVVAMVVGT